MQEHTDYGPNPYVTDINRATNENSNFRTTLWTGKYLQSTLMSIPPDGDIGLEVHPDTDQFLRIESGSGCAFMGPQQNAIGGCRPVRNDSAVFVPAGTWHNATNTGSKPLRLYSIYAPPNHPWGTVHQTKAIAEAEEG